MSAQSVRFDSLPLHALSTDARHASLGIASGATLVVVTAAVGNAPDLAHTALYIGPTATGAWIALRLPLIL